MRNLQVGGAGRGVIRAAIEALFDAFIERGFTYFDTAYTYHGYHGEEAVRHALVERRS